jgi:hypothetical protein
MTAVGADTHGALGAAGGGGGNTSGEGVESSEALVGSGLLRLRPKAASSRFVIHWSARAA